MYSNEEYYKLKENGMFFNIIYKFYIKHGYKCIILNNIFNIISSGFIILFFGFLIFWIKWDLVINCKTDVDCGNITEYIVSPLNYHTTGINILLIFLSITAGVYWLWNTIIMIGEIFILKDYNRYFTYALNIDTDNMIVISWNDIINKMIKYDNRLSHKKIIANIMKVDNYIVAIINQDILKIKKKFFSSYLEWMLRFCIFNRMFINNKLDINFIDNTNLIKRNIKILGVLTFLLSPFIFIIASIYFLVQFTADFYTKKVYLGPKDWSNYAKWKFREFNELPHIFNKRLKDSHKHAIEYENRFESQFIQISINFITLILGALLTILIFITFYDERIMLHLRIYNRNLLWYVAILTTLIALCRMMLSKESNKEKTHDELIKNIVEHTHYYPESWKDERNKIKTLKEFHKLYNYKIISVVKELCNIFIAPIILVFDMGNRINELTHFIKRITINKEVIGDICKYGDFDKDEFGNTFYGEDEDSITANDDELTDEHCGLMSASIKDNKLRDSIKSFNTSYFIEMDNII